MACNGCNRNLRGLGDHAVGPTAGSVNRNNGTAATVAALKNNVNAATINRPVVQGVGAKAGIVQGRDHFLANRALPNQGNLPFATAGGAVALDRIGTGVPDHLGNKHRATTWPLDAGPPRKFAVSAWVSPFISWFKVGK